MQAQSEWSVGLGTGFHATSMRFSNIDKDTYPSSKMMGSGMFNIFAEGAFGSKGNIAIRPQLSFLRRGGKLTDIVVPGLSKASTWEKEHTVGVYELKASMIDLRCPVMYKFGDRSSFLRPYVFVAPVLGFATGGSVSYQTECEIEGTTASAVYAGVRSDLSKANFASTYFAGQIGAGLSFAIPVAHDKCYLGIEACYELGFTNTYGSETDNKPVDLLTAGNKYRVSGSRKFSGFELGLNLTIPLRLFKKKVVVVQPEPVQPVVVYEPAPEREVKDCYTVEEIQDMMSKGEEVDGLTICAVNSINFEFSKSTIMPSSYDYLNNLADIFIRTGRMVEIKGHTDNQGSEELNNDLSRRRAEAVYHYLIERGVPAENLSYSYYGMSKPLTSNETAEGRALNRRVEFTLKKK